MGDRRNVIVKDSGGVGVGLYTHWNGAGLEATVKKALARRQRWDDSSYLARIIFCEMVNGSESDETGFGIASADCLCEGSARDILVNVDAQTIRLGAGKKAIKFSDFVA